MHQSSGRWQLGLALSLLTVFLWGILPIALTVALQALDVYTVIWFRFLVAFSLLAMYLGFQGKLPTLAQLRSASGLLLAIATIFLALNYFLFLQGLALTSPANAQVIIQFSSIFLSLGGLVIFKERYQIYQWLGVSIFTIGYVLFFHEQLTNLITSHNKYLYGSGLIVLGAAAWAVYALAQKQLLQSLSSAQIMLIVYGGCAFLFTPFCKAQAVLTLSNLHFYTLLFCGLNTLIAYGAFAESLAHWEASRVSAVLTITPIVTLIAVWAVSAFAPGLMLPEKFTLLGITGAVLVVTGAATIALGKTD
ncbi:DMT family transporter [Calothrix sp. FACHB-1219]|uniref:DMT family transporter n=1 Tax=unclassified Calothrix TaxID=2619626 RepID=UPI001685AF08|nr:MULTISPECIES: DMT family transporter [unclassified Calothrix]MBD2208218.1 DMT family transporter [Calothrix sp. FACHB-168]MBD2222756.1 DMT family transporter [Calothrix sp. FACHB-1219]